ncbi:MAG: hypothetical protein ACI9SP_000248 [Arenicella sp.]|jgi:hypothetical protein
MWRLGWFLNTLNFQIEKQLYDWKDGSEVLSSTRWSLIERFVFRLSKIRQPILFFSMLIAFFGVVFLTPSIMSKFIQLTPNFNSEKLNEIVEWDFIIVSLSLSLVTLIVPLVLTFVGNSVAKASSYDVLWKVYFDYAGVWPLVTSSFALTFCALVSQYFEPFVALNLNIRVSALLILWLLCNVMFLCWFFRATFLMTDPVQRNILGSRFCLNDALTDELRLRLFRLIPTQAREMNLLQFGYRRKERSKSKAKLILMVSTNDFLSDGGDNYTIHFDTARAAHFVSFRLISLLSWIVFCERFLVSKYRKLRGKLNKEYKITYPHHPGYGQSKSFTLLKSSGFKLRLHHKLLARSAYLFKVDGGPKESNFADLLSLSTGYVKDAIRIDNFHHYEIAIGNLEELVVSMIDACNIVDEQGNQQSWLDIGRDSFAGFSIFNGIERNVAELTKESLSLNDKSPEYFRKLMYMQPRMCGYNESRIAPTITKSLIDTNYWQWQQLLNWRATRRGLNGQKKNDDPNSSSLLEFMGCWESWCHHFTSLDSINTVDAHERLKPYLRHLDNTACMLIHSVRVGDHNASKCAADLLINWASKMFLGKSRPYNFGRHGRLLELDDLNADFDSDKLKFKFGRYFRQDANKDPKWAGEFLEQVLLNYWTDVILSTSAYILQRPRDGLSELTDSIALRLVDEKDYFGKERHRQNYLDLGRNGLGDSFLRQQCLSNYPKSHHGRRLDRLLGRFNDLNQDQLIMGRIYTSGGMVDISSLNVGFKALMLYKNNTSEIISKDLIGFLEFTDQSHRELLPQKIARLLDAESSDAHIFDSHDDYAKAETLFHENLRNFSMEVISMDQDLVSRANLDSARLDLLSSYANNAIVDEGTVPFPLNQYLPFDLLGQHDLTEHKFDLSGYPRSNVVELAGVNTSINEDEFTRSQMGRFLVNDLVKDLWATLKERCIYTKNDDKEIFEFVKNRIRESEHPKDEYVFIVNQIDLKLSLDRMIGGYDEDAWFNNFSITKQDGMPASYLCHFEGVAVYWAYWRGCPNILMHRTLFGSLKLSKVDDSDYYVKVDYEDDVEAKVNIGKLSFTAFYDLKVGEGECFLVTAPEIE